MQEQGNTIARSILRLEAPPHICPSSGFHRKITRGLKHSQENPALFHSDVLFLVLHLLLLSAGKNICKLLIQLLPYFTVLIQIYLCFPEVRNRKETESGLLEVKFLPSLVEFGCTLVVFTHHQVFV